jgi:hypothetical protein
MSYHPRMDLRRGKRLPGIASHAIAVFSQIVLPESR